MNNSRTAGPGKLVPDGRDRYRHFMAITTRLMDNDLYNHLNNATYYSFVDTAVSSYVARAGNRDLAKDPVVYYVVENGCTYFRPIAFPDVVECGLRVTDIGRSSMRLEVGLFRNEEPLVAARAYYVQVCCDRETHRPIPIPAPVRAALEALRVAD